MIFPHKFFTGFILLVLLGGCRKFLDIKPTDVIPADIAITSIPELEQAVTGVYASMGNTSVQNRSAGNADIIISALMSDEVYLPVENVTGGVNTYKWLITSEDANTAANWGTPTSPSNYAVIDRANRVLTAMEKVSVANLPEIQKRDRLKGELLALRAFCHFQILKSYAESYEPEALGIPYMESINDAPASVKPSRLTVAETFAKIERDLNDAKRLIPATPITASEVLRIHLVAVKAIQARVFLYQKKWNEAVEVTTEVISTIPLATRTQFPGIWTDANTAEIIWKLKKDTDSDRIGQFFRTGSGGVEYAASVKLINHFDHINDVRFPAYIKIDNSRGSGKTPHLVNKYAYNSTTVGLADIKLFRVAEMYLIRAEAYAEAGSSSINFSSASADLNALRAARLLNDVPVFYTSKESIITAVYNERFRELAFEGHRYFDLRRRSMDIDRTPLAPDDNAGLERTRLTAIDKAYYLPIPGFELRANQNMVQNPAYQ